MVRLLFVFGATLLLVGCHSTVSDGARGGSGAIGGAPRSGSGGLSGQGSGGSGGGQSSGGTQGGGKGGAPAIGGRGGALGGAPGQVAAAAPRPRVADPAREVTAATRWSCRPPTRASTIRSAGRTRRRRA
ncbi:MAG TPA: hypothetical protein VHU40_18505 [Polyangia bacterium]|nr:hypothetical protein [Polyangia bacterium]